MTTQSRQAEGAVRDSDSRLRTILDAIQTVIRAGQASGKPLGTAIYGGRPMPSDMILTLGPQDALEFRTPSSLDIVGLSLTNADDVATVYVSYNAPPPAP